MHLPRLIMLQRLEDPLIVSADFRDSRGAEFVCKAKNVELLHNAILALISPDLYWKGFEAVDQLLQGNFLPKPCQVIQHWTSAFSAWQVISNRITPAHRDMGAAPMVYDLLTCAGTYKHSLFHVHDLGARFHYTPGTVVALCGRVLRHEVKDWHGGDRICVAHYMRDSIHNRMRVSRPTWPVMDEKYRSLMTLQFRVCHAFK
jgi:hypothetical protein